MPIFKKALNFVLTDNTACQSKYMRNALVCGAVDTNNVKFHLTYNIFIFIYSHC